MFEHCAEEEIGAVTSNKGLVTNNSDGGLQNRRGACEVLPLRKDGAEKVLAMLKGGTKSIGVVFMQ